MCAPSLKSILLKAVRKPSPDGQQGPEAVSRFELPFTSALILLRRKDL